ncbi:aminoglycoside phosphotransferase family protein [Arachnia propionica]|uniref:Aminoglycoside phosphotransferase family protein n=1 Tax=Arachnia propionica TaxID=1750 RepID=A0A3P1T7T3_9ACTN|nr:aminoglycoside phosphotransferase family protein [Arachnia propionica]RRD04886.1 aminoglycoside phosphotransferase family protein [Arachnia propionica]
MNHELVSLLTRVLDPDWLGEHTGAPVRAARLRVKPRTSISVSLVSGDDGVGVGWMRVLWPINHVKADLALRDAERHGYHVDVRHVTQRLVTVTGPTEGDPKLRRNLRRALSGGLLSAWPPAELLRYNPMRRLVVRDGDRVVRIAAKAAPGEEEILDLVSGIVPCPERLDDRSLPGCSAVRFTGDGDLAALPSSAGAEQTGRLIARLHDAVVAPGELHDHLGSRGLDPVRQGLCHADLLDHLAPTLAARVRRTLAQLPPWPTTGGVLSHGDLSPDQVLVVRDGTRVWLTDFDRAQLAPVAADLGSFLSEATPEIGAAFRAGYEAAGGTPLDEEDIAHGIAWSWTLRLMDPLRHADPNWQERVEQQLDRIDEVLS